MNKTGYKITIEKYYEAPYEDGTSYRTHDTIYTQMVDEISITRVIDAVNYKTDPMVYSPNWQDNIHVGEGGFYRE